MTRSSRPPARRVLIAAVVAALSAAPADAADIADQEIAEGLHLLTGAGSNVLAMGGGETMLVVDGGLDANSADLYAALQEATGAAAIGVLIDTHWHPEVTGLNDEAGADGATIVAHVETKRYLSHRVTSALFEEPVGPLADAALPNATTRLDGTLTFAGHAVEYGYLPAAHTNGDLYVYFPEFNVLAAGGVVGSDAWPVLDHRNGAFIGGLLQGYETLAEIVDEETVVVPAAGPPITGADLARQRDMYRQFFRDAHFLMNQGMGYDDVVAINPLRGHEDEYGDPSRFLDAAYRSLEMTNVPD